MKDETPTLAPLRICLVAHEAFGALRGGTTGHIGGVERQVSQLARWLAGRGHVVNLVTWDEGQAQGETIDGVRLIPVCRRQDGWPGLRFVHPRITSLIRALRCADADVYYHNCAEYWTGVIGLWCRRNRRRFVFSVASDPDCDPRLPHLRGPRVRALYRLGLRCADRVVVQTSRQQRALRDGFGLDSVVIPLPCAAELEVAGGPGAPPSFGEREARALWIGRHAPEKRLDRLLEIAVALPSVGFDVVGPLSSVASLGALETQARGLRNVSLHGRIPPTDLARFYRRARCLCCTSDFEGFPNTFLEAWWHGVPVVSTVDPDDLIATRGLGMVADDVKGLARGVDLLVHTAPLWEFCSRAAQVYVRGHHVPSRIQPCFEQVFREACSGGVRGSSARARGAPGTLAPGARAVVEAR